MNFIYFYKTFISQSCSFNFSIQIKILKNKKDEIIFMNGMH